MYRGIAPAPPTSKAPPPREELDPAWLTALGVAAFMAVTTWSTYGVVLAVVYGLLGFVIGATRTRRYTRWKRARALRAAHELVDRVEREEAKARVAMPVRIATAPEEEPRETEVDAPMRARL